MIQKNKFFFLIVPLLLSIVSITNMVYAKEAVIQVDSLNVRDGPGLEYASISKISQGEKYSVLQEQREWLQIEFQNNTGWIARKFVNIIETNSLKVSQEVTVRYGKTNIRSGPSTSYSVIKTANRSEKYRWMGEKDGWTHIEWKETKGYIPTKLISTEAELSTVQTNGLNNKRIVIDAGHGGKDVGAISFTGYFEKDYALKVARKLNSELELAGANPVLSRVEDQFFSLSSRAAFANTTLADAFISIHFNSTPDYPAASGTGTYFFHQSNRSLAGHIQKEIVKETGLEDRGIRFADFRVIRETHQPAVLVELGFISNIAEEEQIKADIVQNRLVKGIINGLSDYFSTPVY